MSFGRTGRHLTLAVLVLAPVLAVTRPTSTASAAQTEVDPAWHGGVPFRLGSQQYVVPVAQVVGPDGSIYVVGRGTAPGFFGGLVTKLDPAGNLDASFGGTRALHDSNLERYLDDLGGAALQGDGLIIVGQTQADWVAIRIDQSGSLDPSFGQNGRVVVPPPAGTSYALGAPPTVAMQPDGAIVLAGYAVSSTLGVRPVVARLDAQGAVDPTFGAGGVSFAPVPRALHEMNPPKVRVAIDSVGRVVVAFDESPGRPLLARLTGAGAPDASFGLGGVVERPPRPLPALFCSTDFVIDPLDRIVVACPNDSSDANAGVSRYRADGSLDTSFGDDGTAHVPPAASGLGATGGDAVALDGDRIILGGRIADTRLAPEGEAPPTDYAVWRFTSSGRLDRTFGSDGGAIRQDDSSLDSVVEIDALPDGRLTALVDTNGLGGNTNPDSIISRLRPATSTAMPSLTLLGAPRRVLDTRIGLPMGAGKIDSGGVLSLPLAGHDGVPGDAVAIAVNVTVTEPERDGFLTIFPCGQSRPVASNVNYAAGQTIPNLVVASLGTDGALCIFSSQKTHVVADVTASYRPSTDLRPLPAPVRVIDTRVALGWPGAEKIGGSPKKVPILRRSEIPNSTWVGEVIVNITITEPEAAGYLTAYQCGTPVPATSNLNFVAGQTISNLAAVRLSPFVATGGPQGVCFASNVPTHLVVDLQATVDIGAAHVALPQSTRLLDTRADNGGTKVEGGTSLQLQISGRASVQPDAAAVGLNITVTEPDAAGYLTVFPCGQPTPLASSLNFIAGQTIPNYVIAQLGPGGTICVFSNVSTHVIADVVEALYTVT